MIKVLENLNKVKKQGIYYDLTMINGFILKESEFYKLKSRNSNSSENFLFFFSIEYLCSAFDDMFAIFNLTFDESDGYDIDSIFKLLSSYKIFSVKWELMDEIKKIYITYLDESIEWDMEVFELRTKTDQEFVKRYQLKSLNDNKEDIKEDEKECH